ncbi:MAG: hypothetical protein ACLR23_26255 [Clostridia bacterium]
MQTLDSTTAHPSAQISPWHQLTIYEQAGGLFYRCARLTQDLDSAIQCACFWIAGNVVTLSMGQRVNMVKNENQINHWFVWIVNVGIGRQLVIEENQTFMHRH